MTAPRRRLAEAPPPRPSARSARCHLPAGSPLTSRPRVTRAAICRQEVHLPAARVQRVLPPDGKKFNHQPPERDACCHPTAKSSTISRLHTKRAATRRREVQPPVTSSGRVLLPIFIKVTSPVIVRGECRFLRDAAELVLREAVFSGCSRQEPVVRWRDPDHLRELLAPLKPGEQPASHDELLAAIREVITYSVKFGHPHFVNQLVSSVDPYGLAGQWTSDALNASVYTYEVAPVFTLLEMELLERMRRLVGFRSGDGLLCPGGSLANGFAINLARFRRLPGVKTDGLHGAPRLALFASEDAHYSVHKMAALLGLGEAGVVAVPVDAAGRMDAGRLDALVRRAAAGGALPFMVVATAGTTVLGAFDPLPAVADVCEQHSLWLHVDAAWGGGLLLSSQHRHQLLGIDRADSVTWNPHKLLGAPLQCSALLVRDPDILGDCHSRRAPYLFQRDKFYDSRYDLGDRHLQCGRRNDVFKFWLMWKAKGTLGLEKHVDALVDAGRQFAAKVRARPAFSLVTEPHFVNVCFWFVPPRLRAAPRPADYDQQLHQVAPALKERMMRKGSMMMNYQPLRAWPNFFRFVVQNSGVTHDDLDYFLDELELLGSDL
ncbi:cysteine sulfinic acid decarboxylase-like [Bacillus rossius redtenbacheri]|uniref:cysteine sulfinic acid decarboxylase-like n=1 Tax=Bacillus rossius redtenbacheri TaxID=93214 RepID=UPI002FDD044F